MDRPQGFPEDVWSDLKISSKAWYLSQIERLGSYDKVLEWMKSRPSGGKSRLNNAQINAIKESLKSNQEVADEYGITASYVSKIRNGHRL